MEHLLISLIIFTFSAFYEAKNIATLPSDRNDIELREDSTTPEFRYFTPKKLEIDVIKNENFLTFETIITNSFDSAAQTIFIIHGYLGGNAQWPIDIKDALIEKEKCNVFIVDWSGLDGVLYGTAMENIPRIGQEVGIFIEQLMALVPLNVQKVHVIGHSLGAHASGFVGKWMKDKGHKIGRITGLDPAGPDFNELSSSERLDRNDADFVDVIHTNWAGSFWGSISGFGLEESIGNFDFYPNGGEDQPGCKTAGEAEASIALDILGYFIPSVGKFLSGNPIEIMQEKLNDLACSHGRAYEFFYWSIQDKDNGCRFSADECPSWDDYDAGRCKTPKDQLPKVQMGYYSVKYKDKIKDKPQRKYFLTTTDTMPYCVK